MRIGTTVADREEERRRKRVVEDEDEVVGEEYEVEDVRDHDHGRLAKRRSRFTLLAGDLGLDPSRRGFNTDIFIDGIRGCSPGLFIHPQNRWYRAWEKFILLWAVYSSFFTPMEFGFFRGLPEHLYFLDIAGQMAFLVDVILQFFIAYRDSQTYKMISNRNLIAVRYLRSHFVFDILACMPWDNIYRASGRKEEVRRYRLLISMHILLFGYNSARSRRRIHLDWESKTTQASERLIFGSIFRDCEYGYSGIKDGKI